MWGKWREIATTCVVVSIVVFELYKPPVVYIYRFGRNI